MDGARTPRTHGRSTEPHHRARRDRAVWLVALVAAGVSLSACAPTAVSGQARTTGLDIAHDAGTGCTAPGAHRSVLLSDTLPEPTLTVEVGTTIVVTTPADGALHATPLALSRPSVLEVACSTLLASGARRTVLVAAAAGTSGLFSTTTPAGGYMMPSWSATVTVATASS